MTEVRVLFPPNKEIADLQTIICAVAMRSTRTKEPAHELQDEKEWIANCHCKALRENNCMTIATHLKCDFYDKCAERMLRNAKKMKHWGVFEFADFTVSVSGVSRALTHQLVRHRLFSYLQQSQRAVEIDTVENDWYVKPTKIFGNDYDAHMAKVAHFYKELIIQGIEEEDARFVLPNATKTHITIKGNARNWLHFFRMRLDPHAQWEIREMAQKILDEFMKLAPIIFEGAGELEV